VTVSNYEGLVAILSIEVVRTEAGESRPKNWQGMQRMPKEEVISQKKKSTLYGQDSSAD
jgi:hypothetical protein